MRRSLTLALVLVCVAVAACSNGDDDVGATAQEFDDPESVIDALNNGGFECTDAEFFTFEYASTGETEAGECFNGDDDVIIVMIPSGDPPADMLEDVSERIVAGPNWIIGTSELTDLHLQIQDAVGGELVWDNGPLGGQASAPTETSSAATAAPVTSEADLVGTTDLDPEHWVADSRGTVRYDVRVFEEPDVVFDYPVSMNGCDRGQQRIRWRSLGEDVVAGFRFFTDDFSSVPVMPEEEASASMSGTLILGSCEEPTFRVSDAVANEDPLDNRLTDIVVEVESYVPAVGATAESDSGQPNQFGVSGATPSVVAAAFVDSWLEADLDAMAKNATSNDALEDVAAMGDEPSATDRYVGCTDASSDYGTVECVLNSRDGATITLYLSATAETSTFLVNRVGIYGNPPGWEPID